MTSGPFTFDLTEGDDTFGSGGLSVDIPITINALGGNDTVTVGGGWKTICNMGEGNDFVRVNGGTFVVVNGENGNDTLETYAASVSFDGGAGDDVANVFGGTALTFNGGAGNDQVTFQADIVANVFGGDGDDIFNANSQFISGTIDGGAGDDRFINFRASTNTVLSPPLTLIGGPGNDLFWDTATGFDGITIADFSTGDRILIEGVNAEAFTFTLSGNTLTYGGHTLTFGSPLDGTIKSANFGGRVQLTLAPDGPNDFNGDGQSDILWRDASGTIFNFLGTANGGFVNNGGNSAVTVAASTLVTGIGDFNGDGRKDILWRSSSGSIFDFLGTANGGYSNNGDNSFVSIAVNAQAAGIGDFNGDGRDDILWRDSSGTIFNFLGTANGGFANNGGNSAVTVATSTQVAGVGDFNGDGFSDILWRDSSGNIFDFLGTANGSYTNNGDNSFVSMAAGTAVAGIGDFNGDGRADVLWRDASGNIFDFLGTANGGFTNNGDNSAVNVGTSLQVATIGDFNGDGRDDILWRNSVGNIFDFLGTANGGFVNNGDNSFVAVNTTTQVQDPFL